MGTLRAGLIQIAPVFMNKTGTIKKMLEYANMAGSKGCGLAIFSEALLPGYPFWTEHTDGARFESPLQKECFRIYYQNAVDIAAGDLDPFRTTARDHSMAMYIGCIEKTVERGTSLFCSLVYIDQSGEIRSVHRKLVPTYEERLFWSHGDGHGLQVHQLDEFRIGGLNCWENWMPGARMALYGQGETIHVSVWPGNVRNVDQIVPFIGREGRCYSLAVCGLFRNEDIPEDFPGADKLREAGNMLANGGTCAAGPDGQWILPPQANEENVFVIELTHAEVLKERHNFDPAGHYSRPDVMKLYVNRERQSGLSNESFST